LTSRGWSWEKPTAVRTRTVGGGGAGKVSVQDFNFTMHVNKASPKLFLACATGQHIKEAFADVPQGRQRATGVFEDQIQRLAGF